MISVTLSLLLLNELAEIDVVNMRTLTIVHLAWKFPRLLFVTQELNTLHDRQLELWRDSDELSV